MDVAVGKRSGFTAKDVLAEWLAAMNSGVALDDEVPVERGTSRAVRYARVHALLRAFDLGTPRTFAHGGFFQDRAPTPLPEALARASGPEHLPEFMREMPPEILHAVQAQELGLLFRRLLAYRVQVERVLSAGSGILVATHLVNAGLSVAGRASAAVAAAMVEVEALLAGLIAPPEREVTEREMIDCWGWPEGDPDELEIDEQ